MRKLTLAAAAAAALVSTAAIASVTFNPDTGTGFVGKGDVQLAYVWNNATMQKNYSGVSFVADASLSYDVTCEWTTVTGGKNSKTIPHTVTNHKNLLSSAAVEATAKKTASANYTGWFLNGYSDGGLTSFTLPQVGDSCPQGGSASDNDPPANDASITAVDVTSAPAGTLSAVFNGDTRVLASF